MPSSGSPFWHFPPEYLPLPAIIDPENSASALRYADLDELAEVWRRDLLQLARELAGTRNATPLVALEFETSLPAIAAYLGALRTGMPLLVLAPGQLASAASLRETYAPDIVIGRQDDDFQARKAGERLLSEPAPDPELAILLSTSGSTGDPKLVRLSKDNIDANARSIASYLELTADDRAITTLPLFYSYGLSIINSYLGIGASIVLSPHSVVDAAFWAHFAAHGVTSLAFVPHQFDLLRRADFAARSLPSLRYITQAGGKLAPEIGREFMALGAERGWKLIIMYGQTEASPRISYVPPEALPEAADTIGRPVPGGRLRLVDEEGAEITASGVAGELVYEGPNVMLGYASVRADFARPREVTVLHTGDVAERTEQGFFRVTGRLKRFVKLYGQRISLDQIEMLLRQSDLAAYAIALDDQLVLLVADDARLDEARQIVGAEYELPLSAVHAGHMAEPPLLPNGKVDKRGLATLARDVLLADENAEGGDATIADLLAQATHSRRLAPGDSFTSLGGDSLSYLNVQIGLERLLGHVPAGWEDMPLAELEQLTPEKHRFSRLDMDILLRVAAIALIVARHASGLPLGGGTWMLILLMGYSASRFQTRSIVEGRAGRLLEKMLYPILPLYFLLLLCWAGYAYVAGEPQASASYYYLLQNYDPLNPHVLNYLWFVSLYVQLVVMLALVAWIAPLRQLLRRWRWQTSIAALALSTALFVGLYLRMGPISATQAGITDADNVVAAIVAGQFSQPWRYIALRGFVECLPIFMLGWAIQSARGWRQLLPVLLLGVIALVPFATITSFRYGPSPILLLATTIVLLVSVRSVPVPYHLSQLVQKVAASTLLIYLLHVLVTHTLFQTFNLGALATDAIGKYPAYLLVMGVAVTLSFLLGYLAKLAFDRVDEMLLRRRPAVA